MGVVIIGFDIEDGSDPKFTNKLRTIVRKTYDIERDIFSMKTYGKNFSDLEDEEQKKNANNTVPLF